MDHSPFPRAVRRPAGRPAEAGLLWAALALLALALFGPALPASAHQHVFADQRTLWGVPCAMDVLSNLPFAMAGLYGLAALRRARGEALDAATRATATLFCTGLLLTALGSAWYHWQPDDAGLLWDRLGMAVAFAGLLGLAAAGRVSARAGHAAAVAVLLAGPLAVAWWTRTGDLLPWAVVQIGGMLVVLALACLPRRPGALALNLGAVIAWYGAAKLFEAADHAVFAALGQGVSGHSLKHLCAAGAALPVLWAMRGAMPGRVTARVQNGAPGRPQPTGGACRPGA